MCLTLSSQNSISLKMDKIRRIPRSYGRIACQPSAGDGPLNAGSTIWSSGAKTANKHRFASLEEPVQFKGRHFDLADRGSVHELVSEFETELSRSKSDPQTKTPAFAWSPSFLKTQRNARANARQSFGLGLATAMGQCVHTFRQASSNPIR
jgi:hypothetical protein